MILAKPALLAALHRGEVKITPFDPTHIGACSVDLTLGSQFKRFKRTTRPLRVTEHPAPSTAHAQIIQLGPRGSITLEPGELVLGLTAERLKLAPTLCARIEGRSSYARLGLLVHLSSSLIQPGVDNHQVLEMMNLAPHPLVLTPGLRICQVVFEQLKGKARYQGAYQAQTSLATPH